MVERFRVGGQPYHTAMSAELIAIVREKYCAATGRDHLALAATPFGQQVRFLAAKSSLASRIEQRSDRTAMPPFQFFVHIDEWPSHQLGEQPPHGGLSRPAVADQEDVSILPPLGKGGPGGVACFNPPYPPFIRGG